MNCTKGCTWAGGYPLPMREIGFGHYVCQSCQHEVKTDMLEDVMKEKARRRDFMRLLYKESGGSEYSYFDEYEIGKELGFDRETVGRVTEYLMGESLLGADGSLARGRAFRAWFCSGTQQEQNAECPDCSSGS